MASRAALCGTAVGATACGAPAGAGNAVAAIVTVGDAGGGAPAGTITKDMSTTNSACGAAAEGENSPTADGFATAFLAGTDFLLAGAFFAATLRARAVAMTPSCQDQPISGGQGLKQERKRPTPALRNTI
jgi:hypothetical protein